MVTAITIRGGYSEAKLVSGWLKSRGYAHGKDYDWYCDTAMRRVIIRVREAKLSTMIGIQFGQLDPAAGMRTGQ